MGFGSFKRSIVRFFNRSIIGSFNQSIIVSFKVYVVEGDHDTFVQGKTSAKTVEIINELILESQK